MNKKSKILVCIIILVLIIALIGSFITYTSEIELKDDQISSLLQAIEDAKLQLSLQEDGSYVLSEYVYDAEYDYDVDETTEYGLYSIKDIVVPYININTEEAKEINSEIKELFDEAISVYKEYLDDETFYTTISYESYINDNILSVIILTTNGGTDIPLEEYISYNFDLTTLETVDFKYVYETAGFTETTINEKVGEEIKEYLASEDYEDIWTEENSQEDYTEKSISNYQNSVSNNSIKYYLNEDGNLNIIVDMEIPAGRETFEIPLEI